MYNHLVEINNQPLSVEKRFMKMYNWLKLNQQSELATSMVASGITTYHDATTWFDNYYVKDQNEGPKQAKRIQNQIKHADNSKLYYSTPDFNGGNDYTPTELVVVDEYDLQVIMDNTTIEYAQLQRKQNLSNALDQCNVFAKNFDGADFIVNLYALSFNFDGRELTNNYFTQTITQVIENHKLGFVLDDNKYNVFELAALRQELSYQFNNYNPFIYQYEINARKSDIAFAKDAIQIDNVANDKNGITGAYLRGKTNQPISPLAFQTILDEIKKQL